MEFGEEDLVRPSTGLSRPRTAAQEGVDDGFAVGEEEDDDSSLAFASTRPLTAMSTDERQYVDAVRPMTGAGSQGAHRPPTGARPPSGFVVAPPGGSGGDEGGFDRPKTSRSRVGTAQARQMQVHKPSECAVPVRALFLPAPACTMTNVEYFPCLVGVIYESSTPPPPPPSPRT